MKNKTILKNICLIFFISLLNISNCFSQTISILERNTIQVNGLNPTQSLNYQKLLSDTVYKSITLCKVNEVLQIQNNEHILLILAGCVDDTIIFSTTTFDQTDDNNYSWYGKSYCKISENGYGLADFFLVKINGEFAGHISLGTRSIEIFDLTDGIQVVCETNLSNSNIDCSNNEQASENNNATFICNDALAKVLVLYTPAANNINPNITSLSSLAIFQINQIWSNSMVYTNHIALTAVLPYNYIESSKAEDDVKSFATDPLVQNLRNQYQAEMVILLVDASKYTDAVGRVKAVGGSFQDMYGVVGISEATSLRYTFAHEVNHFYGAQHQTTSGVSTASYAHGYILPNQNKDHTLMAVGTTQRIAHLSSPYVIYPSPTGVPTGDFGTYFNARKVEEDNYKITGYFIDSPVFNSTATFTNPLNCETNFTATVTPECGTPPYTYEWYKRLFMTVMFPIPGATSSTLNYTLGANPNQTIYDQTGFVCKIKDATGQQIKKKVTGTFFCPQNIWPHRIGIMGSNFPFSVTPNPSNGHINLMLTAPLSQNVTIELYDNLGLLKSISVYEKSANLDEDIELDYSMYSKGLYLLVIKSVNQVSNQKIILN
jgi:hypothetical protein